MEPTIFEKKNILVTGGAGFIGSHLCELLLREGRVICVDDFSNSDPQNINHLLQYPDFEFIKHDITKPFDPDAFPELEKFHIKFQGIQEIYQLACPTSPKKFEASRIANLAANSLAVINTLDLAVRYRAKYVLASSSVVYGPPTVEKKIFAEHDLGVFDHLSVRACYDEGKRFAETCVATYRQVHGIDAKIARIFTTYGSRMKLFENDPIPDFIMNALSGKDIVIYGGEAYSTSLCYVSDLVNGLDRLMAAPPEVMLANLGGDEIVRMVDVAKLIIQLTGSTSEIVLEKQLVFLSSKGAPDLHYTKDVLEWMPLVTLEEGVQKAIDFVIAHKEALLFGKTV